MQPIPDTQMCFSGGNDDLEMAFRYEETTMPIPQPGHQMFGYLAERISGSHLCDAVVTS